MTHPAEPHAAEAFPPFIQRPPAEEVWRRARADYLGGDGAGVVAERYGLSERSVRRRASVEGWRRCDVEADLRKPPAWDRREPRTRSGIIADHPEYREIADARDADAFFLLFSPDRADFRRLAFRRAAEGAAVNRPAQAAAWLRVLRLLDQCAAAPHPDDFEFPEEDHLRAAMLRALHDRPPSDGDDETDGDTRPAA